ncbi:MAG: HNH endonuclease signature motif containing protein [Bdellovibrionota bacterium]
MERITQDELSRFSKLSNPEFHKALEHEFKTAARHELLVVYLMREANRRRIWAEMGFSGLMDYCVRSFKISETDFYRKKSILDTIEELPEIESKILEGKLNTTSVSQAASFLKREAKLNNKTFSLAEKRDVLESLEGKSYRDVQREFAEPAARSRFVRQYTSDFELEGLLDRARKAFSHMLPMGAGHSDLLKFVLRVALEKPEAEAPKPPKNYRAEEKRSRRMTSKDRAPRSTQRSSISVFVKDTVSRRDHYSCAFTDPATGLRCGSKEELEHIHVIPPSKGGTDSVDNLRLVCKSHQSPQFVRLFESKVQTITASND